MHSYWFLGVLSTFVRTGARDRLTCGAVPRWYGPSCLYRRRFSAEPGKKGASPEPHVGLWLYG